MGLYSVGGRSLATAVTANHCGCQLWNPSTTKGIYVTALSWFKTVATVDNPSLQRSSAKGATPTSTVTPDIDNAWDRDVIPPSGTILELATFTTQPTLAGPDLFKANLPAAVGSGFLVPFAGRGIFVPSATGLVVMNNGVVLQPADVTFFWEE